MSNSFLNPNTFRKCPRSPCKVSFLPIHDSLHQASCKYHRCLTIGCKFRGTPNEVTQHLSICFNHYQIGNELVPSTDPISEMETETQTISTSPTKLTDISSNSSSSSALPRLPVHLSSCLPKKRKYLSSLKPTRTLSLNPLLNPYDPNSNRIFALTNQNDQTTKNRSSSTSSPLTTTTTNTLFSPIKNQNYLKENHNFDQILSVGNNLRRQLALAVDDLERLHNLVKHDKKIKNSLYDNKKLRSEVFRACDRLDSFRKVLDSSAEVFCEDVRIDVEEEGLEEEEDEDEDEEDEDEDGSDDDEESTILGPPHRPSPSSSSQLLEEDSMTTSELSQLVRTRLSRSNNAITNHQDIFSNNEDHNNRKVTDFVKSLVNTTWDPSEDIKDIPSKCNLLNLFKSVAEIREKKRKRFEALDNTEEDGLSSDF
ncbi:hypothetical protein CROQUDRAFT_712390 [Cronartium quercuum f. sp. fusiforme G11]|uniref:Uncharacterized protein n=1 Tax=Cronartium quercuum f. sp. fusiforme G11 TaxID=708437 RepID=A0A9P6P077_9BASI|nr:hypothetical protein CROQUDRAFT_712390 [Cronartium quercuum f. sp. fusiforme G11]